MRLRMSIRSALQPLPSFGEYNRTRDKWQLSDELFEVATRAVNDDRTKRQQSIRQLIDEWENHP